MIKLENIVEIAVNLVVNLNKTEDGRRMIGTAAKNVYRLSRGSVCKHPFEKLFWVNTNEAVCFNCGIKLRRK
jgi:hypothetical protein